MKKYVLVAVLALSSISCNGQNKDSTSNNSLTNKEQSLEAPKGSWKVDKEFDENGNLIKYDSIYSWSSNSKMINLSAKDRDSLLASLKSRFLKNFSTFQNNGIDNIFFKDSLFVNRFFKDDFFKSDFGVDVMDIDNMRQKMLERQRRFFEKYQSEFMMSEDSNSD